MTIDIAVDSIRRFLTHSPLDSAAHLYSSDELVEQLRGGGNEVSDGSQNKAVKNVVSASITICAIALAILHWDTIKTFFDREKFRKAIIEKLNGIASKGDKGLLMYAIGFSFWEVCGLPTAVVETAAGMAFGFQKGLLGSFVGKTCGSILAFTLGRTLLSKTVERKMGDKEFGKINRGVARKPMLSALVVRYSVFPQLFKNFGLSMTRSVTYPMFVLAILIHGFPFSFVWAALGNDSSMRLRASDAGEKMAANVILNGSLVFVTVFGFLVSPLITAWWLTDLRREES